MPSETSRPDAVVTRNNQSTLAFRDGEASGAERLALRLRGRGGNPDAIGARVELASGGRSLQVQEVRAGGGFASQSAPTLFFTLPPEALADAKLKIRWPSGSIAESDVPAGGGSLKIEE